EIKMRIFGHAAVSTSRIKLTGYSTSGRMTNVYVKRQGRWQCVASHSSGLVKSAPPPVGSAVHQELLKFYGERLGSGNLPDWAAGSCTSCHAANTHFERLPPPTGSSAAKPTPAREREKGPANERGLAFLVEGRIPVAEPAIPIRPGFPCLVEKSLIQLGQRVKKGQPLFELFSKDLAEAKGAYEVAVLQWAADKKALENHVKLSGDHSIPQQRLRES